MTTKEYAVTLLLSFNPSELYVAANSHLPHGPGQSKAAVLSRQSHPMSRVMAAKPYVTRGNKIRRPRT